MVHFNLKVSDTISPELRAKAYAMDPQRIGLVAGRAIAGQLREHLFGLDRSRPNKLGGKRTHFYSQAARSVQQPRKEGGGVVVSINHVGIRQRYEGGDIRPVRAKFLTIPVIAEAHGKRAREFNNLSFAITKQGPALVENRSTGIRKTKKGFRPTHSVIGGRIYFLLRKKVHQDPDATVIPTRQAMLAVATRATGEFIARAKA